jgi:cell division protein FtsB
MTNEERQELIATLRWYEDRMERDLSSPMRAAADEIDRLTAENKKITAENKKIKDRLLEYVAESNAEFFFASFPEKRADWMKDD